jgi:predicted transcriptional regulator
MVTAIVRPAKAESAASLPPADLVSDISLRAKALFEGNSCENKQSLQNAVDSLTAKVTAVLFEVFRDKCDDLLRVLRDSYGQIACFGKSDFREHPEFYLGQLHTLTEVTYRVGHQRVPRWAVELVSRNEAALKILQKTIQEKSIGAGALAHELKMQESNLSRVCKPLVENELLRCNRFGKRVRYSSTPLGFAVLSALSGSSERGAYTEKSKQSKTPSPIAAIASEQNTECEANADWGANFVRDLLKMGANQGAQGVAIGPSGKRTHFRLDEKPNQSESRLQNSAGESVSEQHESPATDTQNQKSNPHAAFRQIQDEAKENLTNLVSEVLEECRWEKSEAADRLGLKYPEFDSLIKSLYLTEQTPVPEPAGTYSCRLRQFVNT